VIQTANDEDVTQQSHDRQIDSADGCKT